MTEINLFQSGKQTMSSDEIAELTGKEKFHVVRDIHEIEEKIHNPLLENLDCQIVKEVYKYNGRKCVRYYLNKAAYEYYITNHTHKYDLPTQKTYIKQFCNTEFYKIGKSINPEKRLAGIILPSIVDIKTVAVVDKDVEHEIHKYLELYRDNGEWFHLSDSKLKEVIFKWNFKTK